MRQTHTHTLISIGYYCDNSVRKKKNKNLGGANSFDIVEFSSIGGDCIELNNKRTKIEERKQISRKFNWPHEMHTPSIV